MLWKSALINKERGLVIIAWESGPRRNASLVEQSRGPNVWSAIHDNILGGSIDMDAHHECTGQRGTMKYLKESCYHCIECSVANSLVALMWKWYLNNNFQPYNYSQRFQEGANGTEINVWNLAYTWRVEMKKWRQYKKERIPWRNGLEN